MPDYITDPRLAARLDALSGESDLPSMHPPIKRYDPTSGMTGMDKFLAGAGRSVVETGRGLGQLAGVVSQADIDAARRLDVPLMATGAGQAGNIAGSVAQMYGPGVMVKGAAALPGLTRLAPVAESLINPATVTQAGLLGGMFSAVQPTATGESRGLNAALGTAAGAGGQAVGRYIAQGVKGVSPYMKAVADKARKLGAKTTPGAETGNAALRQVEASFASNPLTANKFAAIKATNQEVLNKTAARAIGEDSAEITEHVLGRADKRIKNVFSTVFKGKTLAMPDTVIDDLATIDAAYGRTPTGRGDATFKHVVDYLVDELEPGTLSGRQYLAIHNELQKTIRGAWRGENANPELAKAVQDILDVLDKQAGKPLSDAERAAYATARTQWGNKTKIEATLNGPNVSGPKLANLLKRKDKTGFLRGGGRSDRATQDLYDMARFADVYRPIVGDSGTATRLSMPQLAASEIGNSSMGGLLAHAMGVDPWAGMLAGAAGAPMIMKGAQAGYLSGPARGLLTYGGMGQGVLPQLIQGALPKAAAEAFTPEQGAPAVSPFNRPNKAGSGYPAELTPQSKARTSPFTGPSEEWTPDRKSVEQKRKPDMAGARPATPAEIAEFLRREARGAR